MASSKAKRPMVREKWVLLRWKVDEVPIACPLLLLALYRALKALPAPETLPVWIALRVNLLAPLYSKGYTGQDRWRKT